MAISVALATLGCKVNQAETEDLRQELEARGYLVTGATEKAQVYVINTCTVTHIADRKSRNLVQRACRANPQARVLVTGCYAQRAPQELPPSPQVQVIPKGTAEDLAHHLDGLTLTTKPSTLDPGPLTLDPIPYTLDSGHSVPRRRRALIKAHDGCDQHCTYCVVPLARGGSHSLSVAEVVQRVKEAVTTGHREVVLTGVNLTYYGQEWGGTLGRLLDHVLEAGPERLRLSSLQPEAVTEGLLRRWQDRRLCRHFHLALQSGSDSVLSRMERRYTAADFREAVRKIRVAVPGASITTDVMVGFPGETTEEFEESYEFCAEMGFTRMHVFQYSSRPGTAAARMAGAVPDRTAANRSERMLLLAAVSAAAFRQNFLGSTMEVLFEEEVKEKSGYWRGLTDNYLEVEVWSDLPLANQIRSVRLDELRDETLIGTIVSDANSHN